MQEVIREQGQSLRTSGDDPGTERTPVQGGGVSRCHLVGMLDAPGWHECIRRIYGTDGLCPTIPSAEEDTPPR